MPYYEFACNKCGNVIEKFYRSIPRISPEHVDVPCEPCGDIWSETRHRRIMSRNTFHLKGGGVGWGAGRYSSAHEKGTDVVSIDEP